MFTWRYNISGGRYLSLSFYFKDTETFTKGDILTLDTGELDLGATNDTTFAGAFDGPFDPADAKKGSPGVVEGTDSTTLAKCIVNPDAVYGSADNNARNAGVNLDISGATGRIGQQYPATGFHGDAKRHIPQCDGQCHHFYSTKCHRNI